tara:strand:+ start:960 stop:1127 length:168 start_codon:yes stop_codon:yes gene_type:complete
MRKCRECNKDVPTSELCKGSTGGKVNLCKGCRRKQSQKWNKKRAKALKDWRSFYG